MSDSLQLLLIAVGLILVLGLSFIDISQFKKDQRSFCKSHGLEFVDWTTETTSCFNKSTGTIKVFVRDNS